MFTPLIYGVIVIFINMQRYYMNIFTEQQLCISALWRIAAKEIASCIVGGHRLLTGFFSN